MTIIIPTPVGPKKRKLGGWFSLALRLARVLSTAFATAWTASSWPTTRLCRASPNFKSLCASDLDNRLTGIPVQRATTLKRLSRLGLNTMKVCTGESKITSVICSGPTTSVRNSGDAFGFFSLASSCFAFSVCNSLIRCPISGIAAISQFGSLLQLLAAIEY